MIRLQSTLLDQTVNFPTGFPIRLDLHGVKKWSNTWPVKSF